jgi:predicted nucleic-acid-binding protein
VIGLDANLLIRYFAKDDPAQTPIAVNLIHSLSPAEPGWIGFIALVELVWILTRTYRMKREGISAILSMLLASKDIVIEQSQLTDLALRRYLAGKADFPDCLIAVAAEAAGCSRTVTFDRIAARDAGMELLG